MKLVPASLPVRLGRAVSFYVGAGALLFAHAGCADSAADVAPGDGGTVVGIDAGTVVGVDGGTVAADGGSPLDDAGAPDAASPVDALFVYAASGDPARAVDSSQSVSVAGGAGHVLAANRESTPCQPGSLMSQAPIGRRGPLAQNDDRPSRPVSR